MPSPIASVLASQGGRFGGNAGARQRVSRITSFGNTVTPTPAPTAAAVTPASFGAVSGYSGTPVIANRPSDRIDDTVPPPGGGVGTGVKPVPPDGSSLADAVRWTANNPGVGGTRVIDHNPGMPGTPPPKGPVNPRSAGASPTVLPGAPYTDVQPGGTSRVADGALQTSGVLTPPADLVERAKWWASLTEMQKAVYRAQGAHGTDQDQSGEVTPGPGGDGRGNRPGLVQQVGDNLPGEQDFYNNQIARRSRGLFEGQEAKTNYGLERLEDRGMGSSSVAGQVAGENYGQYLRDSDAAASDVQAKQFSAREQRMADARKFEFDKAIQASQYALQQKDDGANNDEAQLQAALALIGRSFGSGGASGLWGQSYKQGGR